MPTPSQNQDWGWETVCLSVPTDQGLHQIRQAIPANVTHDVYLAYTGAPSLRFNGFLVTEAGKIDRPLVFCPTGGLELGSTAWRIAVRQQFRIAIGIASTENDPRAANVIDLRPEAFGPDGIPSWVYGLSCVPVTYSWDHVLLRTRPFCASLFIAMAAQPEARAWLLKNTPEQVSSAIAQTPVRFAIPRLKQRQADILNRMCVGLSEKEIAQSLSMSHHTVHAHIKQIYRAFRVRSRSQLLSSFIAGAVASRVEQTSNSQA
jgi:DNA-binding CsgD family transcriptional regulator